MMRFTPLLLCAYLASSLAAAELPAPMAFPGADEAIEKAVQTGLIPGAVLLVGHNGSVVYRRAYGSRALVPNREPMSLDTIFDAASLTKVVATTPAVMQLFEQGKIRLDDPVTHYLPEFQHGKSDITVRLLLTHFSGMPPDLVLQPPWSGYQTGIEKALVTQPVAPPGAKFIYSDINFILLGEIVHRVSGQPLNEYVRDHVFGPLGMKDTGFMPPAALRRRIAPTEIDPATGQPFRGTVHDPTSRYMGGVAGHAGVFTTGDDLARYALTLLGNGEYDGAKLASAATVLKFTTPGSPADQPILRGLGWDIDSPFSSNRGELFPIGSYGHTGFTGTSLWIDPYSNTFVILLTNAVHPHGGKSLTSLRSRVATTVAARFGLALRDTVSLTGYRDTIQGAGVHRVVARNAETLTGLDVLETSGFTPLKGKRIGLITNQTGLDRQGDRNVDVMQAAGLQVVRLFSPEHGISGTADANVANTTDAKSGLPVVSLYAPEKRHLAAADIQDLDAVVFDIQDVGARFYTYSCTMLYALQAAADNHKPFFLLDRPNPITGVHVEGPTLDRDLESFVGCYDIPVRHGMTFGELATMANAEQHWNADLHVVKMSNWERGDWWDSTSLFWRDPSPNMRSLNAALLYPGLALLEMSPDYSVGRGTDAPFEQVGAPWIDGVELADFLNRRFIPGVRVYPTRFTPTSSVFSGQQISGIRFVITDRDAFDSVRLGLEVAAALEQLFPGHLTLEKCQNLIGNPEIIRDLETKHDASAIWTKAQADAAAFDVRRKAYLLY